MRLGSSALIILVAGCLERQDLFGTVPCTLSIGGHARWRFIAVCLVLNAGLGSILGVEGVWFLGFLGLEAGVLVKLM